MNLLEATESIVRMALYFVLIFATAVAATSIQRISDFGITVNYQIDDSSLRTLDEIPNAERPFTKRKYKTSCSGFTSS